MRAAPLLCPVVALLAGTGLLAGCSPPPSTDSTANDSALSLPVAPAAPLVPGDPLPPLEAAGWVNGPPPVPGPAGPKALVVDVWADWCPFCRATAPGLVDVYRAYQPKGVAFVSLTSMPKSSAENYSRQHGVPWPCGYLAMRTVAALGATNPAGKVPGYDAAPTLYVVGPDGKVRWSDERARYRHVEPKVLLRELAGELDRVLAEGTGK